MIKEKLSKKINSVVNTWKRFEEVFYSSSSVIVPNVDKNIQLDSYSCGAHSLHILLQHKNIKITLKDLKEKLNTNVKDGTGEEDIYKFLKEREIEYILIDPATEQDLKEAIDEGSPVMTTVDDGDHYTIIYGYSTIGFFLADSARIFAHVLFENLQWDKWLLKLK